MPPGGYHGRYLRVDLTTSAAQFIPLHDAILRRCLGGSGLGTWLLLAEAPAGIDPLDPAEPLILAFSPLVGSPLTTSAKFAVVAKSPLTGRINDAISSSHFALAAKRVGADAIVIRGAAPALSALVIDGGAIDAGPPDDAGRRPLRTGVTLLSVPDLAGRSARDTERDLATRLTRDWPGTDRFRMAAIGIAGERLVRFATLSNGGRHAGRGGHGAVLGSKNLKAIAVRGKMETAVHDVAAVSAAAKDLSARSLGPATEKYRELGTVANLVTFNRLGTLPTRNFSAATFEAAGSLSGEALAAERRKTRSSCAACTIGCEHIYGVRPDADPARQEGGRAAEGVRIEYESLFALGSLCGIGDPETVLQAAALCDELGLDTISTGGTLAFAFECADRGLLDPEAPPPPLDPPHGPDAVGDHGRSHRRADMAAGERFGSPAPLPFTFGSSGAVLETISLIAHREGIGHLLAEGSRRMARAIGNGAASFAPHVKGLEIPGYEPRRLHAMALGLAVGTRGADHNRSSAYEVDFSPEGGADVGAASIAAGAVEAEDRSALLDSLILCKFLRGVFTDLFTESASLLAAVTGWAITGDELHETVRRIVARRKWFNQREGWTPAEDTLPSRFLHETLGADGARPGAALSATRLQALITAYNQARGWGDDGILRDAARADLDLPA
ncbi:MAG: aldehyde ferredoxin oxidoreductase family protein [Acidobacteriota bacterium]